MPRTLHSTLVLRPEGLATWSGATFGHKDSKTGQRHTDGSLGRRYLWSLFLLSCGYLPPDFGDVAAFLCGHGDNGPGCGLEISPGDALGAFLARLIGRPDSLPER